MAATPLGVATVIERLRIRGRYRYYVLGLMSLIALLNTMDQSILSVTLPAIQSEFRISDGQVGLLASAFVIVYGLATLPAGYWADRHSRRVLVGLGVALWSLFTLMTGLAHSYPEILAARAAVGIGEATSLPVAVSLLGDYFGKHERGRVAGAFQAALQLGLACGLIAGGVVAARLGWRSAFYLAALPGLLLALLTLTLREPARGSAEASGPVVRQPHAASPGAFARLLRIRTLQAAIMANTFVLFATTGVGGFIAIYVTRQFGVGLARVGALIGVPLLIGSLVGNALAGWLIDWRGKRSPLAHLEITVAATICAALGLIAAFSAGSVAGFEAAFLFATLAGNMGMPGLIAINQNLVIPPLRGSATALQQLTSNLLGRAAGLSLIGLVSGQLHDLRLALLLLAPAAFILAAAFAALGLPSVPRDVAAMECEWARFSDQ